MTSSPEQRNNPEAAFFDELQLEAEMKAQKADSFLDFENNFHMLFPGGATREEYDFTLTELKKKKRKNTDHNFAAAQTRLAQIFKDIDEIMKSLGINPQLITRESLANNPKAEEALRKAYIEMRKKGYKHQELAGF